MRLFIVDEEHAELAMRALVAVATVDGAVTENERALLDVAGERYGVPVPAPGTFEPEELRGVIDDAEQRERLIQSCVMMAMMDSEADACEATLLREMDTALGTREMTVTCFNDLTRGRTWLNRARVMLSMIPVTRPFFAALYRDLGLAGVYRMITKAYAYEEEHPAVANRYRALGDLPEGTLGRAYYDDFRAKGIPLPGEPGALHEGVIRHDLAHIIGGYDTDPRGEMYVLSFSGGFLGHRPFNQVYFGLCQFHMGHGIVGDGIEATKGLLEDPAGLIEALEKGDRCNADLMHPSWDPWLYLERDLEEVRKELMVA